MPMALQLPLQSVITAVGAGREPTPVRDCEVQSAGTRVGELKDSFHLQMGGHVVIPAAVSCTLGGYEKHPIVVG
ncbi:hypothetical protein AO501_29750 [Mycobacterium gordonae]|uniref:Uncharacterized protein n=1 Tax=Mycobacterium gordonae TaxID=1778 RepID=A0A0Q2X003_MYCGO|nr:hypothetical protein AO501_29750 [Mycobacterium gordonae]